MAINSAQLRLSEPPFSSCALTLYCVVPTTYGIKVRKCAILPVPLSISQPRKGNGQIPEIAHLRTVPRAPKHQRGVASNGPG